MKGKKEPITLTSVPETRFIFTILIFFHFFRSLKISEEKGEKRREKHTHTHRLWELIEKAPLLNTIELNPIQCILFERGRENIYSVFRLVFHFISPRSLDEMAMR